MLLTPPLRLLRLVLPAGSARAVKDRLLHPDNPGLQRCVAPLIRTLWFKRLIARQHRPLFDEVKPERRFIIVAQPRTGSNLLVCTLSENREVLCNSEAFSKEECYLRQARKRGGPSSRWLYKLRDQDPLFFIRHLLFAPLKSRQQTVGFKLFLEHYQDRRFHAALESLFAEPDLSFIVLSRNNKLEEYLSLARATMTEQWIGETSQNGIHLDPESCEDAFERSEKVSRYARVLLKNRKRLAITYEEMCADFEGTMERVQSFLELTPVALQPALKKQRTRSLRDSISNYDALKEHFRETRWSEYFYE